MYNKVPITQQIPVYFRKFARINIRESAWKYILFSGIIALIIGGIVDGLGHSGVFVTVSGCIWLGIFNTIQSVCKEHDIINSEYRQGMNIGAYVIAQVLWQAVLCLIQALVMFVVLIPFQFYSGVDGKNLILLFLSFYVLIFGAAILGLMVSCIASTPTTAMTIMPFILIVQLLMCDDRVMFELNGVGDVFSCITFSRWGMHAVGSIAGLQNDMRFADPNSYGPGFEFIGGSLLICLAIILLFTVIAYIALAVRNKKS